jgi:hypothetical protein
MKKIWGYLAAFFAGLSAGLILMYKLMGEQIEINIKRIKTKRGSSDIDIPIVIQSGSKRAKRANRRAKKRRNGTD